MIMDTAVQQKELLYAKLNLEASQMPWRELQRYFAGGTIITVHDGIDMIEVAVLIASDDVSAITKMLDERHIEKVTDAQAQTWLDADADLWAVVVKPWILVQARKPTVLS